MSLKAFNFIVIFLKSRLLRQQRSKGLVTNYGEGGYKTGGEGYVKFYPYEEGAQKVLG